MHPPLSKRVIQEHNPALYTAMTALAAGNPLLRWPLFIWGEAGSGKTCASLLYCQHDSIRLAAGYQIFFRCDDFAQHIVDGKCGRLQSTAGYKLTLKDVWKHWAHARVAVLDDLASLGTTIPSEPGTVLKCLELRQGRPTIYTANHDRKALEKLYGDPIVSRLSAGTIVETKGDLRQHKQETTDG